MRVETIKVKSDNAAGYRIINADEFDPKTDKAFDEEGENYVRERNQADAEATEKVMRERKAQANFGQVSGNVVGSDGAKNPSGTYSEPTPTDIRYPDKDTTEFENNHGAFVNKSAAGLREELGLADAPGGLAPDPTFQPGSGEVTKAAEGGAVDPDIDAEAETQGADSGEPTEGPTEGAKAAKSTTKK